MIEKNIQNTPFITDKWPLDPSIPTIIFIHGAGNSKNLWAPLVQEFSPEMNKIALDLPGHGESSEPGMSAIGEYAEFVEKFISEVNPPTPVPCGLSMGGAITLTLLLDSKTNFKAGIIINSGAKLKVLPVIFDLIKNNYSGYISSIPAIGASSLTDHSKLTDIVKDAEKCTPEVVHNDFTACNNFDVSERLSSINVPVLILTADEDKLSPQKYGKFLADNIPGSSHVNISGAGHFSPVERPEVVNEAILEFVKRITSSF